MPKRNRVALESGNPAGILPEEHETEVVGWLREPGAALDRFEETHRRHMSGAGGDYEFDAMLDRGWAA